MINKAKWCSTANEMEGHIAVDEANPDFDDKAKWCIAADETNHKMSGSRKELLHWHKKLCVNIQDVQQLMNPKM